MLVLILYKTINLSKDILQENLVCEALVSSVTSLDNKLSLPMARYYVGKKGKTGENMMSLFTEQVFKAT